MEESRKFFNKYGENAITFNCTQKKDSSYYNLICQWETFGTNASIVKTGIIKDLKFKREYEFGFGEDADFGMQIRKNGCDILYTPNINLLHLKAPSGGFRIKHQFLWSKENIKPKPSPTLMYYYLNNLTKQQFLGLKTYIFIKNFKNINGLNFITYYKSFNQKWNRSIYWAKQLTNG